MTQLGRISQVFRDAQSYIYQRSEALDRNRKLDAAKKKMRDYLMEKGREDEDGNLVYTFPRVLESADGKRYSGVELRKSAGMAFFDEDEIRNVIPPELQPRVFRTVEVLEPDEVYVLQQEGKITEGQLRGLLHYPRPSYALWPVEYQAPLEEEED